MYKPTRKRVLMLVGSLNQTTQMHQIAQQLPECEHAFAPYWCDGLLRVLRELGLMEFTVAGEKLRQRALAYLREHALTVAPDAAGSPYDLVLTCSDLLIQRRLRGQRLVLIQEGILDPPSLWLDVWKRMPVLPRWLAGTATTGQSLAYEKFCVASEGYRDHFVAQGVPAERMEVTGIPNFDACVRYLENDFPLRGYVLVCTSDGRETFKRDDRRTFIDSALAIARARRKPLVFKLHPNENVARARAEIQRQAPEARVFSEGCAEVMVANCDTLLTQWSSTAFVGLALGKEVFSYFDLGQLRRLLPLQNGCAAQRIAQVCRTLLAALPRLADPSQRAHGMGVPRRGAGRRPEPSVAVPAAAPWAPAR
jgi:hypothetical protein